MTNQVNQLPVGDGFGELIAGLLPELMPIAVHLAPSGIDAEDLLADAVARLLAKSSEPGFTVDHPKAYLAAVMRNIVLDFHRSPRSQVDAKEPSFFTDSEMPDLNQVADFNAVDLHQEFEMVNAAFETLSAEQQTVLRELLLRGRAPQDLSEQLGIGQSTIAVRLFRAKSALRRGLLVQFLDRGDEPCRDNAKKISAEVELTPDSHSARQRGIRHVQNCETCRNNWSALVKSRGVV